MKARDIRSMTMEEIRHKLVEMKSELMHLRFQRKIGQLTDTSKLKKTREEIARFITIQNEKELQDGKK
jgi:large subunit ribosomal protein L29